MKNNNPMCLSSFILGCISIFIPFIGLPIISIVFGIIGLSDFNAKKEKNKWFGVVGLILGILYLLSWVYNYSQYY